MERGEFIGFYSTSESTMDGDSGFSVKKTYWQAWDGGPRAVSIQKLGPDLTPTGGILPISRLEFEDDFMPEDDDLAPMPRSLQQTLGGEARAAGGARQQAPAPEAPRTRFAAGRQDAGGPRTRFETNRQAGPRTRFETADQEEAPRTRFAARREEREAEAPGEEPFTPLRMPGAPAPETPPERTPRPEARRRKEACEAGEERVWRMFARALEKHRRGAPGANFDDILQLPVDWLPEYKHLFSRLAVALRKLKLYEQALEYHEKALELAPEDYHILFNMARAQYAMGDASGAKKQLEAILKIDPGMRPARRFLEYLEGGEAEEGNQAPAPPPRSRTAGASSRQKDAAAPRRRDAAPGAGRRPRG